MGTPRGTGEFVRKNVVREEAQPSGAFLPAKRSREGALETWVGLLPLTPSFLSSPQMNLLLREYLLSGEVSEAERCLRQLEVPHFHHELVYEVKKRGSK